MSFITMRHIDSTAQSIDALIQIGAREAACDLLQAELGPLSSHVGMARVDAWCAMLELTQLLELPKAIAASHVVREMRGAAAIPEFMAIAQTARAQGDEVAEYRALAGVYCAGFQLWSGFGEMQRAASRINELHEALRERLSKDDGIECLAGLLVARMMFADQTADAAGIGEALVALALDATLAPSKRLCAGAVLAPWFEQTRDSARLHRLAEAMLPLTVDDAVSIIARLDYRTAVALTDVHLLSGVANTSTEESLINQLMLDADARPNKVAIPQWLRCNVYSVAARSAMRGTDEVRLGKLLDQLEALIDPSEGSQMLGLHYLRATRALQAREYSVSLAHAQRCVELASALEMPTTIALLYESAIGSALLGMRRLVEARAIYVSISGKSIPGQRLKYERVCALIDAAIAIDARAASANSKIEAEPYVGDLQQKLADYLRVCGGHLPPTHSNILPHITQPVVAAIFAHGLGTEAFAEDVRAQNLSPPRDYPVSWPWLLRVRLFNGFTIEGINSSAQDTSKKGESKSTQILQYLTAHAPATVAAQRMADALWPEAEGDKAMRSLDVALTRLRHVLPDAALLVRHEGKIGFDLNRVWCDTHAALALVDTLRSYVGAGANAKPIPPTPDALVRDMRYAQTALALLDLYRGPMLPDSREAFARDRSAFFRSQVAGAVQIGLRAAIRLPDQTMSEEIVRKSVSHGLPADVVRSVITDLQASGEHTSRKATQLSQVFELARA